MACTLPGHPDCEKCAFHEGAKEVGIAGRAIRDLGSRKCVLVVGQSPGVEEDKTGRVFIGRSGKLLEGAYVNHMPKGWDIVATNAVKCVPPYRVDPRVTQCKACGGYLGEDFAAVLEAYDEVKVLCLGKVAALAVLGSKTLKAAMRRQGELVTRLPWADEPLSKPVRVFTTYHPAFILRDPKPAILGAVEDHLALLREDATGTVEGRVTTVGMSEFRTSLGEDRPELMWLDIETYGIRPGVEQTVFNPHASYVVDGVKYSNQIVSIAFSYWKGEELIVTSGLISSHEKTIRGILSDATSLGIGLGGTSIAFDLSYLKCRFPGWVIRSNTHLVDLCAVSFAENPNRPEGSLKDLSPLLLRGKEAKYEKGMKKYGDDRELLMYNMQDVINPARIYRLLVGRMEVRGYPSDVGALLRWYSFVVHRLLEMGMEGTEMDKERLGELERQTRGRVETMVRGAPTRGPEFVLRGKGSGLYADWLFNLIGTTEKGYKWEMTKTGVSTGKSNTRRALSIPTLSRTLKTRVRLISHYRTANKLLTSYLSPMEAMLAGGSRVWPTWFPVPSRFDRGKMDGGTRQGRITCKRPALQTSPPQIKALFKSRYRGGCLVSFDFSQLELRVAALLSGDQRLLQVFRDGRDIHQETLDGVYGRPVGKDVPNYDRLRKLAKYTNFGTIYGIGPPHLREVLWKQGGIDVSELECAKFITGFRRTYWGYQAWQRDQVERVRKDRRLELPITGQWLSFADPRMNFDKAILNFPIQTTAANICLVAQGLVKSILDVGARGVVPLQIYDAVLVDLKWKDEEGLQEIERVMTDNWYLKALFEEYGRSLPITVDRKILYEEGPQPSYH